MRYIKLLSVAAIIIALAGVSLKLYTNNKSEVYGPVYFDKTKTAGQKSGTDTGNETVKLYEFKEKKQAEDSNNAILLWAKIIFSGLFCLAALFVVLSNKYNDETKKWAFSVLTLIAGVWIGTVT